jgi:hypothetical protein
MDTTTTTAGTVRRARRDFGEALEAVATATGIPVDVLRRGVRIGRGGTTYAIAAITLDRGTVELEPIDAEGRPRERAPWRCVTFDRLAPSSVPRAQCVSCGGYYDRNAKSRTVRCQTCRARKSH